MRKGIDTLAFLVKEKFEIDSFNGQVFLFVVESRIALRHFPVIANDMAHLA